MRKEIAFVALVGVAAVTSLGSSGSGNAATDRETGAGWADVANRACERMEARYSVHTIAYWRPLYAYPRRYARIARLRREFLRIHIDALREIRAQAPARTRVQRRALEIYRRMLATIPPVIVAAERKDRHAYDEANLRMVLAIQSTRDAFARAGTSNICNWGI